MKLLSYLLIAFLAVGESTDRGEWELKKSTDNIDVYIRSIEGSAIKEFKATTIFENTSIEQVFEQVYGAPKYKEDCTFNTSYFIEELSNPEERYFYYSEKLPWPLKNRDVVSRLMIEEQTSDKILLSIEVAPDALNKKEQTIRIEKLAGFWLLEKHPTGIKATQQIFMDPGGAVPSFLVNSLLVKGPLKTFSTLKKTLQQ